MLYALLAVLACLPLPAAYSNLIAAGETVYFKAPTGLVQESWFALSPGAPPAPADPGLTDVNNSGTVFATATYGERVCGVGGSSCFIQAGCQANFAIRGPESTARYATHRTFARLNRSGSLAWITQDRTCTPFGQAPTMPLNGIYDAATLRLIVGSGSRTLANLRSGRRLITDRGAALTFSGIQLQWLDQSGARNVRHVNAAYEAVTDARGENIVYVEAPLGNLHWIAAEDESLGFTGSAPALSDDGLTLYYLDPAGALRSYSRTTRTTQRLGIDTYTEFTASPTSIFAVSSDGRLVRIVLATGMQQQLLAPLPQIQSADLPPLPVAATCPIYCYGTPEPQLFLGPGMLVVLRGVALDQPGWRVSINGVGDLPLIALDPTAAYFIAPATLAADRTQPVEIFHPEHPLRLKFTVQPQATVATCFGTLHQNLASLVTPEDPALPGEVVSLFVTGLNGCSQPPALSDSGAAEVQYCGPAPGLMAIDQLNLKLIRPWRDGQTSIFSGLSSYACTPPAVR